MKILIDPKMAILIRDFSDTECAELLRCIFEYPNRDCDMGLWKYMKEQIDIDAQKYKEKCDRIAVNRLGRSGLKSTMISDVKSDMISSVREVVDKDNIIKDNSSYNESVSSNSKIIVENAVDNFLITNSFSFNSICKIKPKFTDYIRQYIPAVIERAQKTLIQKRIGQTLNMLQILEWIEKENLFYKQNHRGIS